MRRNRRRRGRTGLAIARGALRAVFWLAVVAVSATVLARLAARAKAHPYFALREIDVEGCEKVDAKTVLEWAALSPGMSIWKVDERAAERRLLAGGRIRAAHVETTLPARVAVAIEERQPIAIVLDSEPLLVAADGTVFRALEGESLAGLPYLSRVGGNPDAALSYERLRQAAAIVARWQLHADWPPLSEVRPDGDDFLVFAAGTPMAVRFSGDAPAENFTRLAAVLDLWRGREAAVSAIDVSMPGQAVMKLRRGKAASSVSRSGLAAAHRADNRPQRNSLPRRGALPGAPVWSRVATPGAGGTT